jgi:hypothetical protein
MREKVVEAIEFIKSQDGPEPQTSYIVTLERLAEYLNAHGTCAWGAWVDGLAVWVAPGRVEEYHPVASFGTWTDSGNGKFIGTWWYESENQPNPDDCGGNGPPPDLDCGGDFAKWNQRCPLEVGRWHTCTPLVGPDRDYCASQGWTDGRLFCPPRPNGHAEREACEVQIFKRTGGDPPWSSDGETILKNRLMARCRSCSYLEVCLADGSNCRRRVF